MARTPHQRRQAPPHLTGRRSPQSQTPWAQTLRSHALGPLVTGVTYRYPALLAKIVTTLDVLSSGRAMFGIGAAWYDREHHGLGVPYPAISERFERLEEALQLALQMWSDNDGAYEGKHYTPGENTNTPPAPPTPKPPTPTGGK